MISSCCVAAIRLSCCSLSSFCPFGVSYCALSVWACVHVRMRVWVGQGRGGGAEHAGSEERAGVKNFDVLQ